MTTFGETAKNALTDMLKIRKEVLETVEGSWRRLTPADLEKTLLNTYEIDKQALKVAMKNLVADGELSYTYQFGCSFLEKSFNKPTRVSKRVVLKPPGVFYKPKSDDVVVELQQGASFGSGEHPTTRLSIRGIEKALSKIEIFRENSDTRVLDIGTGSGVLAIVAVALGAGEAVGIDIDPCAIAEAKENVKINNLENRIEIYNRDLENIDQRFSLITANLRYPTLKRLCSVMAERLAEGGSAVVSGVKTEEVSDLLSVFTRRNFRCIWEATEKDWTGLVFVR
ncbi:50S ribosomal protein L11 methyltransferase [Thermodesulfobacteriota bacterium]